MSGSDWTRVISLHAGSERGFPRPQVEHIHLIAGFGLEGDRKAGKRENRAVLLLGRNSYDHLAALGLHLPYGGLGENIVLDGDPHTLEVGSLLAIGETLLEISLYCTPCKTLRERYGEDFPARLGKRRGMLARVLRGGPIKPGDGVLKPGDRLLKPGGRLLNLHITASDNASVAIDS
jgi:MOSC domain-containing protein YiiM